MLKQSENISEKKVSNESLGNKLTNRKLAVFSIFLLLSFLFWYLDALGKEIEADIKYPVIYKNIPELIDSGDMPQRVTLFLNGTGFSILRLKFTGKSNPVIVDFSRVTYKKFNGRDEEKYFLVTSGMENSFSTQLKPGCKISSVSPDTLFFLAKKE